MFIFCEHLKREVVDSEQQEMEKTKQKYHKSYSDWQEAIQVEKYIFISVHLQCLCKAQLSRQKPIQAARNHTDARVKILGEKWTN